MSNNSQQILYYLFIGNTCEHSRKFITLLKQSNLPLLKYISIINIEDNKITTIPKFITRVPTLYIPLKKYVIDDSDLFKWLEMEIYKFNENKQNNSQQNQNQFQNNDNILPFQTTEMGNGISGSPYSFIEDNNNEKVNHNFSFINEDHNTNTIPDFDNSINHNKDTSRHYNKNDNLSNQGDGIQQRKSGGDTNQAYENLLKSRNSEYQQQNQIPQTPNFTSPLY